MKMVSRSHQGLVRLNNEDCVYFDVELGVAILADGMGGLLAGEEASRTATLEAQNKLAEQAELSDVIACAHQAVRQRAEEKKYVGKMGTTLLVWQKGAGVSAFAHVGDSRIYSLVDDTIVQLSKDQTVAQRMVDEGIIPPEEAHLAPKKNVLTQAIGMPGVVRPEINEAPMCGRLLLCSDGLSDLVDIEIIKAGLALPELDAAAEQLVKEALDRGGRDNVSVIVIDLDS